MSTTNRSSDPPGESPRDIDRLRELEAENAHLRRRLEAAEAEAARHRQVRDHIPVAVYTKDLHGHYTGCNAAFEAMTGYGEESLLGKTARDIAPAEAADFHEKQDREMFERPDRQEYDYTYRSSEGTRREGLYLRAPLLDGQGRATGLVGVILDITQRKEAEEALRRSEQRLELILRHSSDGIHIAEFDPNTNQRRLVLCNDRFVQMSGRTREELISAEDLNQFVRRYTDPKAAEEVFRKILEGGPFTGQGSWIRPDGRENYCEWTAASTRIGSKVYVIGIDRDVTERHQADRALRESEEKYRAVVETSGETIAILDENGTYLFANRTGAERLGLTPEQLVGKTLGDVFPKDVADCRDAILREVARTGRGYQAEVQAPIQGQERWERVSLQRLPAPPGAKGRVLVFARDITERKRAEEALRRREQSERYLRGQLTALHQVTNELSRAGSFDELCRQAIELGRSRLGFDRLGLWFTGDDPRYLDGSYGTDENGRLRDERSGQAWLTLGTVIAEVMNSRKAMVHRDDSPLFDGNRHVVGQGQLAVASLWDGEEIIGCLTTDNLLRNQPLSDSECEVLMLYASAIGRLCSRQRSVEALRRSEELYRTVVESAGASISQIDESGVFLFMNTLGARWLGLAPAQAVGQTMWDLFPREYADGQMEIIRQVVRQGKGRLVEVPSVTAGTLRWFRVSVEPLTAPRGQRPRVLVFARDVTERHEMESALEAFNRRLRGIVENSWDVIFEMDLEGKYTYGNPAAERLTGYPMTKIIGMSLFDLVAPEFHETMRERLRRRQAGGELPQPFQFEIVHRDGHRVFVELVTSAVLEDGKLVGIQGIARDITDRLRAEKELRETRERLEHLISSSPAVIYSMELCEPTRTAYVSPNATRVLGHAPQQLMDHAFWDSCLHPEDHEAVHKLDRFHRTEGSVRTEYRFRHGDGSYHWMLDEFNVVRSFPSGPAEAIGHVVDITARKQAEEALREVHRQLVNAREEESKRLAAELHDSLGQELISLHLRVQSLLPDLAEHLDRKHRQDLDVIVQRCQDAIRSVRNISHGLYPPLLESVGLAAALREMASRLTSPIPIRVDCASSLEKLRWPMAVEIALFRIAQEALRNAVRHSQASRVKLALEYRKRQAVLSIRDDGVGFDTRSGGPGLGLSTMRDRAQTVGGELIVESRPGSTRVEARVPAGATRR